MVVSTVIGIEDMEEVMEDGEGMEEDTVDTDMVVMADGEELIIPTIILAIQAIIIMTTIPIATITPLTVITILRHTFTTKAVQVYT